MCIYATKSLVASKDVAFYCILARTQPLGIQEKIDIYLKRKTHKDRIRLFVKKNTPH